MIQDKLLSLDDYELYILKKIVDLSLNYGINSHKLISDIIYNIGRSSVPGRNNENFLKKTNFLFDLIKEYEKQYEEYKNNTIKAAKEFGNLPILVINREKIAKNETSLIRKMLDDYSIFHDIELLKNIIIKFNNNRNGCRGIQHEYIREKYFSDQHFQEILNKIDSVILKNQKELFFEFVKEEHKKMSRCFYDDTTIDMPILPNELSIRSDLNV